MAIASSLPRLSHKRGKILRIAVDLMGSDSSPKVLFEAVLQLAEEHGPSITFIILATKIIAKELHEAHYVAMMSKEASRIEFHIADEVIAMEEEPLYAVRHKKTASLVKGLHLLKRQHVEALVSAGNTGALVIGATLLLPMLPGINRPALLALLPTKSGVVAIIDVGGNVYCKAHHLVQFALMAAAYKQCSEGIDSPVIGLLNIGVESKKGTHVLRQAYQALMGLNDKKTPHQDLPLSMHFVGNVEGREIFDGKLDIVVTDGFTGNVLLKTTEGVASFILSHLSDALLSPTKKGAKEDPVKTKIKATMNALERKFNYAEYPGAIICGVEGVVVKCHGNSSTRAMYNGISGAIDLVKKNLIKRIKSHLLRGNP
jgi:glycerol-3-phosphate acyltransferase PlsX